MREYSAAGARVDGGDARVVAFINKRSGGQRGEAAHAALVEAIGADNVFTLVPKEGGPRPGLEELARAHYDNKGAGDGVVVLCCGGDGTFNWISTVLLDLEAIKPAGAPAFRPELVTVPLGTGNDLSRALGWGKGYPGDAGLKKFCADARAATRGPSIDLWTVRFAAGDAKYPQMENYCSVGVDAEAARRFAEAREANPEAFSSQWKNKSVYAQTGAKLAVTGAATLNYKVKALQIAGEDVPLPHGCKSIVVLNIASFGAGTDPWGKKGVIPHKKELESPAINDGLLEVVALGSIADVPKSMLTSKIFGYGVQRVGQGDSVRIEFKSAAAAAESHSSCCGLMTKKSTRKELAVQVDGEAWAFPFADEVLEISLKGRVGVRFGPSHAPGKGISAGQAKAAPELGWDPAALEKKRASDADKAAQPHEGDAEGDEDTTTKKK